MQTLPALIFSCVDKYKVMAYCRKDYIIKECTNSHFLVHRIFGMVASGIELINSAQFYIYWHQYTVDIISVFIVFIYSMYIVYSKYSIDGILALLSLIFLHLFVTTLAAGMQKCPRLWDEQRHFLILYSSLYFIYNLKRLTKVKTTTA